MDLLQERYHWTDEYILNLGYCRLIQAIRTADKKRAEFFRAESIRSATNSWLLYWTRPLPPRKKGAAPPKRKDLKQWLNMLGLGEDNYKQPKFETKEEEQVATKKQADEIFNRARLAFSGFKAQNFVKTKKV